MSSRQFIRPNKRDKWRARRAEQSQLGGDQVNIGKSFAAGCGSESKLSSRTDGEQKRS